MPTTAMVLADGTAVSCSRTENADLFRHAMGGYGLFGVITELELDMVPNARLAPRFEEMSGLEIGARFAQQLASPFPLLAAVAARTSRIEIGTGVIDMRYENPFYMAEDAGAADLIAQGRLQLGISRGSPEQVIDGYRHFGYVPADGEDDGEVDGAATGCMAGSFDRVGQGTRRRSVPSQRDMSLRITRSPADSPLATSISWTAARPKVTGTRTASSPTSLNRAVVERASPMVGRAT